MAVDTRQKRFSMLNFSGQDITVFEADSSVDTDDKQHLLDMYSGIPFSAPSAFNKQWWYHHNILGTM